MHIVFKHFVAFGILLDCICSDLQRFYSAFSFRFGILRIYRRRVITRHTIRLILCYGQLYVVWPMDYRQISRPSKLTMCNSMNFALCAGYCSIPNFPSVRVMNIAGECKRMNCATHLFRYINIPIWKHTQWFPCWTKWPFHCCRLFICTYESNDGNGTLAIFMPKCILRVNAFRCPVYSA